MAHAAVQTQGEAQVLAIAQHLVTEVTSWTEHKETEQVRRGGEERRKVQERGKEEGRIGEERGEGRGGEEGGGRGVRRVLPGALR